MKDLKDMCMIEKSVLQDFMKAAGVNDDTYIRGEQKLRQALNQDLSGMYLATNETFFLAAEARYVVGKTGLSPRELVEKIAAAKEKNDD